MANGWSAARSLIWLCGLAACSGHIDPGEVGGPNGGPGGPSSANGSGQGPNGTQGGSGAGAAGSGARPGSADDAYVASESVARRLSRAEIDNVVRDLFGDDTAPATRLLAEDLFSPFDNDYRGQVASGALIDSLEGMANDVAAHVVNDAKLRPRVVPSPSF